MVGPSNRLKRLKARRKRIEAFARYRDILLNILLKSYAGLVPEALDALSPDKLHYRLFRMLYLKAATKPKRGLEMTGVSGGHSVF